MPGPPRDNGGSNFKYQAPSQSVTALAIPDKQTLVQRFHSNNRNLRDRWLVWDMTAAIDKKVAGIWKVDTVAKEQDWQYSVFDKFKIMAMITALPLQPYFRFCYWVELKVRKGLSKFFFGE